VLINKNNTRESNTVNQSEKETEQQIKTPVNIYESRITKVLADDIEAPLNKTNRNAKLPINTS
jgi:hypothetical protein